MEQDPKPTISKEKDPEGTISSSAQNSRRMPAVLKWACIILGVPVVLVFVILCGISIFLTPERLTTIVNREASQYINADIHAHNISYTLWSTFPRFRITTDSIVVRSRTLDSIPQEIRSTLPENADFLGALKSFSGSINVIDLFLNRYVIHDVEVDGLQINLVAYNDSINNYNIVPSSGQKLKTVPYFSADLVALKNPGALTYFSHASDTKASLQLTELVLKRIELQYRENAYRLSLGGKVTATSAGIPILHNFPFDLDGDLTLRFDPFGVALSDYSIDLGEIHSKLSMSVGIGDDPRIESFNYKIASVNLMNLLGYIPHEYLPSLEGLQADLPISASAHLMSSWNLSNEVFPSIEVDFKIPKGQIDYTVSTSPSKGEGKLMTYCLDHSPIEGKFVFNGDAPDKSYLDIPDFSVFASGVNASLRARVTDLTADPLIRATLGVEADIAEAMKIIPTVSPIEMTGNLSSTTDISFRLSSFSRQALADGLLDIRSTGGFEVNDLKMRYPGENITLRVNRLTATIGEDAEALTPQALNDPFSNIGIGIDRAEAFTPFGDFNARDVRLSTIASAKESVTPQALSKGLPLKFDLKAGKIQYNDKASSLSIDASGVDIADVVSTMSPQSFREALSDGLEVKAAKVNVNTGNSTYILRRPELNIAVAERNSKVLDSIPYMLAPDSGVAKHHENVLPGMKEPAHTPKLLSLNVPGQVSKILNAFHFSTDLKVERVELDAPGFRDDDYMADIDLSLTEEALDLRNISLSLSGTPAHLSGKVKNLRGFFTQPASENNPLVLDFDADIDQININALTHNYVESKGGEKAVRSRPTSSPTDTIAMLVPRNIVADIRASVGQSSYTNLNLTDIIADIAIANGVAKVNRLGMAASFGRAEAAFTYDTSDLYHMSVGGDVHINDVDIVKFFLKFPSLLRMMPQMKNLSGYLSINGTLASDIFPTMYLNVPSARADLNLHGRELLVHQSHFIRKITKMMMIRTDADIHIKDIDVQAAMHDNLLQLYPFNFEFDRYKLHMLGVNNFNGKLYYHIGVEKSPIPFPFSINIEGMFHDPKLRFGGAHYDIHRGEAVTSEIQEVNNVNLVHVMRGFLTEFVCTGAKYGGSSGK